MSNSTVIIDVRTPEEFADGHLEGAININIFDPMFEGVVAALDTSNTYLVYCRSGQRSGNALAFMNSVGFDDVTNLGGVADASETTGIRIVT